MMRIPRDVREFARVFRNNGYELYIVGGAVRDALLGRGVIDYDFATSATPAEVQGLFRRTIPTGIRHGTVTVLFRSHSFEVTTYRTETDYTDHRRPDRVAFTRSLTDDLSRRDFTMNALAVDPTNRELIDPFNGREDLAAGVIRTVGSALERFREDALRIVRCVRFAATLRFALDEEVRIAMSRCAGDVRYVAVERVFQELSKMMTAESPSRGWRLMRDTEVLQYVLPELIEEHRISGAHAAELLLFDHFVGACDCAPAKDTVLRWAALLHDIGKPRCLAHDERGIHFRGHDVVSAEMAESCMKRLRAPKALIEAVTHLIRHHMFNVTGDSTDRAIRRFLARVGRDHAFRLTALRRADVCGKTGTAPRLEHITRLEDRIRSILETPTPLTTADLAIGGKELMQALEIEPGPMVGTILQELLQTVIDDPSMNEREKLITIAERVYYQRLNRPPGD